VADNPLLLFGASVRAAALSALRAGLRPWCADLFGDCDLRARCPTILIDHYPDGLLDLVAQAPPVPWMYTGALENRLRLIRQLSRQRPLWGNDVPVLRVVRSPQRVCQLLTAAGLPCPAVSTTSPPPPSCARWLVKPLAGAGGIGIRFWDGNALPRARRRKVYFQEFISGESGAALFLGDAGRSQLLGVTRQLVGEAWLGAAPFRYCGSIGPLDVAREVRTALERIGKVLVEASGLRGLFGIDFVLRDGIPWPVEVNPRYTASVEVLEYATGLRALALHRQVFVGDEPGDVAPSATSAGVVGKAVLFARAPLTFPEAGPWLSPLHEPVEAMPNVADIPPAGSVIETGRPVLTFFARAEDELSCLEALRRIAADLDTQLYRR
jgi:uncharacterized protein